MSNVLTNRTYRLLDVLSRMESADRETLLDFLNEEGCEALTECIHNGLWNGELDRDYRKSIKSNLKKDEKHYRCILKEHCPKKKRKHLVQVGGGGLGLILQAVLPVLKENLNAT